MQELIKVTHGAQGERVVSARSLYEFLGYDKSQWKRWYEKNIIKNTFAIENQDWEGFDIMSNGNETKDFALSLDFAKRLAQMARTEKGEEVRDYFIECERKLKQQQPNVALPSVKELAMMVIKAEEEKELLLAENAKLLPKAEYTDLVLQSDKLYTTTEIAKELGMSARRLNETLCFQKIQYKHRHHYVLSAKYSNKEYTQTTTTPYIDKDGVVHTRMQMEWTEYGRAFIQHLFNDKLSFSKAAQQNKRKEVGHVNA